MKKIIIAVVVACLLCNLFTLSVLGSDDVILEDVNNEPNSKSIEVAPIPHSSMQSKIKEKLNLAAIASTSFPSSAGGTLYLDYQGSTNPFEDVIMTKVVYLNRPRVEFLEYYYYSDKSSEVESFLDSQAQGIITSEIAEQICNILECSSDLSTFIVGFSVDALFTFLDNLDNWDFSHALSNSMTGKLKVIYQYQYEIEWDTLDAVYLQYNNYEPWDDGMVTVPSDYYYVWNSGIYDMGEIVEFCEHQFQNWVIEDSDFHVLICSKCLFKVFEEHTLVMSLELTDETYHYMKCNDCNYTSAVPHIIRWNALDSYQHKGTCTICNHTKTESHASSYDNLKGRCRKCGYTGPIINIRRLSSGVVVQIK